VLRLNVKAQFKIVHNPSMGFWGQYLHTLVAGMFCRTNVRFGVCLLLTVTSL